MKLSILVPVYGVEEYIERCARSLFEQTYLDIEYVFVDDCSPDKSMEILYRLLEKYPNRKDCVKVIRHQMNKGSAEARNRCIEAATGDFILWVDADDYVSKDLANKVIAKQQESNADIVCFDAKVLFTNHVESIANSDYVDSKDFTIKLLLRQAPHQLWGHLIRRSLYLDNNIYAEPGVNQGEDLNIITRIAYFSTKVTTLHEVLYYYDMTRQNSYSNSYCVNSEKQICRSNQIIRSFFREKGVVFVDAVNKGEIVTIPLRLRSLSLIENDEGSYNNLLEILLNINKKYWLYVKWYDFPVLLLREKSFVKKYEHLLNRLRRI